jgi:hypothetical protein
LRERDIRGSAYAVRSCAGVAVDVPRSCCLACSLDMRRDMASLLVLLCPRSDLLLYYCQAAHEHPTTDATRPAGHSQARATTTLNSIEVVLGPGPM